MDDDDIIFVEDDGNVSSSELFGSTDALDIAQDDLDAQGVEFDLDEIENREISSEARAASSFGTTWPFDYVKGDFVGGGAKATTISDLDAFAEWAKLAIRTQKGIYDIFDEGFGVELEPIFNGSLKNKINSHLESEIRSALSEHERFLNISNFSARRDPDNELIIHLEFDIETTAGEVEIATQIGG